MAHIVLVTSGIASIHNAAFELARLLQENGHRITYASTADIRQTVTAQGLPYVQLNKQQFTTLPDASASGGKLRKWLTRLAAPGVQREQALQHLPSRDFESQISPLHPDLIIIDIELNACIIAAAALKVPVALFSTWVSIFKRRGVPPLHLDIIPQVGWQGSPAGIEWAWFRYRVRKWLTTQWQRVRSVGADPISVLRTYANQTGFPFSTEVDRWQWLLPFSYRTLPVLCVNALEFDFPHSPHPAVYNTGAMIQLKRKDPLPAPDQERLDHLLASAGDAPLIYCAFGAFFEGDDLDFFQRVVKSATELPDYQFIIGLGGRWDAESLGALPENVHAFRWVPQLVVLERAHVAVIHAGISTINECIHFGVPMLVYPFTKTTDQMGNAARVRYHGLGIVSDRATDSPSIIAENIRQLLCDPVYKNALSKMQTVFEQYRRERRAVHIVESILASKHTDDRHDRTD